MPEPEFFYPPFADPAIPAQIDQVREDEAAQNAWRANTAALALDRYCEAVGEDGEGAIDLGCAIEFLVASLMHLARAKGLEWGDIRRTAAAHFDAEVNIEKRDRGRRRRGDDD